MAKKICLFSRLKSSYELAEFLELSARNICENHFECLFDLKMIFAPTSDWDDYNGELDIANNSYTILMKFTAP